MEERPANDQIDRMKKATDSRTDSQLAEKLKLTPAAITNARKRNSIPRKWYNRLMSACAQISGGALGGAASVTGIIPPNMAMDVAVVTHDLVKSMNPKQLAEWVKTGLIPHNSLQKPSKTPVLDSISSKFPWAKYPQLKKASLQNSDGENRHLAVFSDAFICYKGGEDRLALLSASGNLMHPEIKDGDSILIDLTASTPVPDKIFAVDIGGVVSLMRIYLETTGVVLRWDSQPASSEELRLSDPKTEFPKILGQVVAVAREWKTS